MKPQPISYWQYKENKPIPDWLSEHRLFRSPNLFRKDKGIYEEANTNWWFILLENNNLLLLSPKEAADKYWIV